MADTLIEEPDTNVDENSFQKHFGETIDKINAIEQPEQWDPEKIAKFLDDLEASLTPLQLEGHRAVDQAISARLNEMRDDTPRPDVYIRVLNEVTGSDIT